VGDVWEGVMRCLRDNVDKWYDMTGVLVDVLAKFFPNAMLSSGEPFFGLLYLLVASPRAKLRSNVISLGSACEICCYTKNSLALGLT
jgi:hypothetical protein